MRGVKAATLSVALILVVAACGDDDGGVKIDRVWSRAGAATQETAAIYMDLESSDGDTLIGVSVDGSIAGMAGLHQTAMADMDDGMTDEMSDDIDDSSVEDLGGAMTMEAVEKIVIPEGEPVALEPGGFHIMMMDLAAPLAVGDTFDVTLQFEMAGEVVVQVEVREDAP